MSKPTSTHAALRARILARIVKNGRGCWVWQGKTVGKGYPVFKVNNVVSSVRRVSYVVFGRKPALGCQALWSKPCGNPRCVNPTHLKIHSRVKGGRKKGGR
jgi:hypothetical protein